MRFTLDQLGGMADGLGDGSWRDWSDEQAHEVEQALDEARDEIARLRSDLAPDDVKALLGWLNHAESPWTNSEGFTTWSLILPETLLRALQKHLEALK